MVSWKSKGIQVATVIQTAKHSVTVLLLCGMECQAQMEKTKLTSYTLSSPLLAWPTEEPFWKQPAEIEAAAQHISVGLFWVPDQTVPDSISLASWSLTWLFWIREIPPPYTFPPKCLLSWIFQTIPLSLNLALTYNIVIAFFFFLLYKNILPGVMVITMFTEWTFCAQHCISMF